MQSFYRSGLLVLTLMSGYTADVGAQSSPTEHDAWVSDVSIERLQDSSVLAEYFGESISRENANVSFRVGFIPRFGCAPLITFKFGKNIDSDVLANIFDRELDSLRVSIDGVSLPFPALVDEDGDHHSIYMNASLQRRITAKLKVEIGTDLSVRVGNSRRLSVSLRGSRDAISIANQNCRRHDPSSQ